MAQAHFADCFAKIPAYQVAADEGRTLDGDIQAVANQLQSKLAG